MEGTIQTVELLAARHVAGLQTRASQNPMLGYDIPRDADME